MIIRKLRLKKDWSQDQLAQLPGKGSSGQVSDAPGVQDFRD
jgi:hypothetical protein